MAVVAKNSQNSSGLSRALAVMSRYILLAALLGYAALAIWINLGAWQKPLSRSLVPEDTLPANIEPILRALPSGERDALEAREKLALQNNPLDLQALKNLIILNEIAGKKEKSEALILVAAQRSLRDLPLQTAAINIQISKQNFGDALYRMDALIRSKPEFSKNLFSTIMGFAALPAARLELVKKLAEEPPWRSAFMNAFNAETTDPDLVYGVYSDLRKAGQAVSSIELKQLLQRLLKDQAFEKASFIWLDFLNEVELRKAGLMFDGGFDLEFGNRYFDWTSVKIKNVEARIVPRATGSADRVLRLDFAAGRTAFDHLSQLLRLPPGSYVFSGEQKAEKLESTRGMIWVISCEGANKSVLLETKDLQGSLAWTAFSGDFTVPATDCGTQKLRLKLNAKAVLDQQVSGQVFYDGLNMARAATAE